MKSSRIPGCLSRWGDKPKERIWSHTMVEAWTANPSPPGNGECWYQGDRIGAIGPAPHPHLGSHRDWFHGGKQRLPQMWRNHTECEGSLVLLWQLLPSSGKGFLNLSTDISRETSMGQALCQSGDLTAPRHRLHLRELPSHRDPHTALRLTPGPGPCYPVCHLHYPIEAHSVLTYFPSVWGTKWCITDPPIVLGFPLS